ncbi:MAG: response regulator [Myxococcales bacterium]|nr:response regulator [Myxococcales bacterium]
MRRILIVDDSPIARAALQGTLERFGFEIEQARDGQEALARAATEAWDLIFLDVVMPILDGVGALQALRARGDQTPVVLVTSVASAATVSTALKLGGVCYLAKPFDPTQVERAALHLLRVAPGAVPPPPRVLVQRAPGGPTPLAGAWPAHVVVEVAATLAESLDRVEAAPPSLVLLDTGRPLDEVDAMAGVVRQAAPAAGIFALAAEAAPDGPWDALDGVLAAPPDPAHAQQHLYPLYVRPLAITEGEVVRVAGPGPAGVGAAYGVALRRTVVDACRRAGLADAQIDLRRVPLADGALVELIADLDARLRATGVAPAFVLPAAARAAMPAALGRALVVAA